MNKYAGKILRTLSILNFCQSICLKFTIFPKNKYPVIRKNIDTETDPKLLITALSDIPHKPVFFQW